MLLLTSATGSPGLTTTAIGLTLYWPSDVLLADCDRDPSQAIQAGYLKGADVGARGLTALARLHRESEPLTSNLPRQTLTLSDGPPSRHFLPGFSQPGAVRLFEHVWPDLAAALADVSRRGTDVLVDAGRIGRDGLPLPMVMETDAVAVIVRTHLRALASLRLYIPILVEQLASAPVEKPLGLVLVGPGQPYSAPEISSQFGLNVWAALPWQEKSASVFADGTTAPRRHIDSGLVKAFRHTAQSLSERLVEHRDYQYSLGVTRVD